MNSVYGGGGCTPLKITNKALWADISFSKCLRGVSLAGVGTHLSPRAIPPLSSEGIKYLTCTATVGMLPQTKLSMIDQSQHGTIDEYTQDSR